MNIQDLLIKINKRKTYELDSESLTYKKPWYDQQIYVFEYYLLQLNEYAPSNDEERTKIQTAIADLQQYIIHLYKYANNPNLTIKHLKRRHAKRSSYMLEDAVKYNDDELLEAALAAGAKVNRSSPLNHHALTEAIANNNLAIVERLIEAGANVNIVSGYHMSRKKTPLIAAVNGRNLDMVKFLIAKGADVNQDVEGTGTALYESCQPYSPPEITDFLLSIPDIVINGEFTLERRTVLSAALESMKLNHDDRKVRSLLKTGRIEKKSRDFYYAIHAGIDAVKLMLDAGYACTAKVIYDAINHAKTNIIDLVVQQKGADIKGAKRIFRKHMKYTEVMFYTSIGDVEKVKYLLALSKDNINHQNKNHATALMIAVELGRTEIASMLLDAGAHVDCMNTAGVTPLMLAAREGHAETVKLLVEHHADVNKKTHWNENKTALFMATEKGHADIVECLLNLDNIDIAAKTDEGVMANDLGLKSKNKRIADAYKFKNAKPLVTDLKLEIQKEIKHFRDNSRTFFSIGNNKKANKIQDALNRADQSKAAQFSMQAFLNHHENEKESIMDALSYHRTGFFRKTRSSKQIESYVESRVRHSRAPR